MRERKPFRFYSRVRIEPNASKLALGSLLHGNKLLKPLGDIFLSFGKVRTEMQKKMPLSYFLLACTDIDNEQTRDLIKQKKEWLLNSLRKGWLTGELSNGKIAEGDCYNVMSKYIIRNATGTLPEYKDISSTTNIK